MLLAAARGLVSHALPILIAQLSSIGMMVVDTAVLGHVSVEDLAAVAIGGGIHISIVFALVGILQALAPVVAHLHGAKRRGEVANVLQQGFWLALALSVPGCILLSYPAWMLAPVDMDPVVAEKVTAYLGLLAWGMPAALVYRAFYFACNAVGRPRVLMLIGIAALVIHALLAWGLALEGWWQAPMGVVGCAWSNVLIAWLACFVGAAYLAFGPLGRTYALFSHLYRPEWLRQRELLKLGLPMGLSNLVEITSFTLIALFIAPLGATVVAGHRIVANLSALTYMLPLALGIATMSAAGQALGARDFARLRATIFAGLAIAAALSTLSGLVLWWARVPVTGGYTTDTAVHGIAITLVVYVAIYQFFDALQTIAGHALRAYRITFVPMLIQTFCFWGIGLGGGFWLCFHAAHPMGVAGFWLSAVLSLIVAAALLLSLLWRTMQAFESTS